MKVYFAASSAGITKYKANYLLIMSAIRKLGLELVENHFTSRIKGLTLYKNPQEVVKGEIRLVSQCDVLIADVAVPSFGVGVVISHAVYQRKPVLVLYPDSAPRADASEAFTGYYYDLVKLEFYNRKNLNKILHDYLVTEQHKGLSKFNFLISPEIDAFLERGSKETGKSKSEFLREEIIREIISKDRNYQSYIKTKRRKERKTK